LCVQVRTVFFSPLSFVSKMWSSSLSFFYLAAVLLKQYVKQHWQEGEENFIPPAASLEDKVWKLHHVCFFHCQECDETM
jgi:hypothetical protein